MALSCSKSAGRKSFSVGLAAVEGTFAVKVAWTALADFGSVDGMGDGVAEGRTGGIRKSCGAGIGAGGGGAVDSVRAGTAGAASGTGGAGKVRIPLSVGSELRSTGDVLKLRGVAWLSAVKPATVKTAAVNM